jgi:sugar phosphate isomerase/epimerase
MGIPRRGFVKGMFATSLLASSPATCFATGEKTTVQVGICDWSYGGRSPKALEAAKEIGLDGVEISPAKMQDGLSYSRAEVQEAYRKKSMETGVAISSLALLSPITMDARATSWFEKAIDAAQSLGAKVVLLAFFGKADLGKKEDKSFWGPRPLDDDAVRLTVERLKTVAPRAKERGVVLGLENMLSAQQNNRILDAIGHSSVGVYYDIANSARNGYDVPAEIRLLKDRICQFHFKDNKGLFNSGEPEMGPIIAAVKAIKYKGWLVLERSFGKDRGAYFKKNAQFIRNAFGP